MVDQSKPIPCPLCNRRADHYADGYSNSGDELIITADCRSCGQIWITSDAISAVGDQKHILSAHFRKLKDAGERTKLVKSADAQQLVRDTPRYTPVEQANRVLSALSLRCHHPGSSVSFDPVADFSVTCCHNDEEAEFYLKSLVERNLIRRQSGDFWLITSGGWDLLEQLRKSGRTSSRVFVAMPFDPSMNKVFDEGIAPAIVECGYRPERVDRQEFTNRIDDEIVARLRDARFVVADYTGQKAGVYFEAGFGLGAGKTVVSICQKEELSALHFDTRQYNMIDYSDVTELRTRLKNRILAVEGRGPEHPSQA